MNRLKLRAQKLSRSLGTFQILWEDDFHFFLQKLFWNINFLRLTHFILFLSLSFHLLAHTLTSSFFSFFVYVWLSLSKLYFFLFLFFSLPLSLGGNLSLSLSTYLVSSLYLFIHTFFFIPFMLSFTFFLFSLFPIALSFFFSLFLDLSLARASAWWYRSSSFVSHSTFDLLTGTRWLSENKAQSCQKALFSTNEVSAVW